jgi:glycosyltransferase A (GT-A) superfamily protein (DUF2064 family)
VSGDDLATALAALHRPDVGAAFGPADDGGWWAIGLRRPDPRAFVGIVTSRPDTGARQRERLARLGLRIHELPAARDVDDIDDARAVAAAAPGTRFARTLGRLGV